MSVKDFQLRVQERPASGKDDDDGVVYFDPQTRVVFTRFEIHGDISVEVLPEACGALGFWMINKDWVQEMVSSKFGGRSFIDRNEFFHFVQGYTKLFLTHMKEKFNAADRRRSGRLGPAEISQFLRVQGITPVNSVVEELMSEVSGPGKENEHLDLEQFLELNKVVWKRAGFTRTETAAFQELLLRYPALAAGNHGEAGIEEHRACMRWLGFPASRKNVEVLFAEALDDKNWGCRPIVPDNERDFLLILRAQREQWIRRVMRAFSFQDQQTNVSSGSPDGCLQHDELQDFMEKLGFIAWPEALKEAVQDCRLANKPGLIFEDLYQILETFRKKEGFVREELEDIKETYRRFDPRSTDNIFGVQLHNALRWAGWNCTLGEVLDTMVDFDLDENEAISQIEFVKLVRQYRERLVVNLMNMYKEKGLHLPGKVTEEILKKAIATFVNPKVSSRQVAEVWDEHKVRFENGVSSWEWTRLVMQYWRLQRDRLRGNWGFNEEETRALKTRFSNFDLNADGNVYLADRNSASLMEDLFPDVRNDPEAYRCASEWIAELQQCQNGALTFDEFLRKMRQVQDAAAEEYLKYEEHARQEAELSRQEVKEFRKIFSMFDEDTSGQMSLSELKEMLGTLTSINAGAQSTLRDALRAVDKDGNRELDFPEFLRLMKKLESENWNDISVAAAAECNKVKETLHQAEHEMYNTMMSKTTTINWPENMEEHVIQLDPEDGEMTP
jgi:Ca2+-binding EF-hand superfamily protein